MSTVAAGLTWVPSDVVPEGELARLALTEKLDFCFVDAARPDAARIASSLSDSGIAALWAVPGVLGRVAGRLGWARTIAMSASAPGELAFELDRALHDALDSVRAGRAAGVAGFVVADDLAGPSGWLLSPDYALDALVPSYRRLASECGECARVFHSDGDVRALYHALSDAGFDAVHVAVPTHALAEAAHAAVAVGLRVYGGIPAASAPGHESQLARTIAELAGGGAFSVCDDGAIQSTVELEACLSIIREVRTRV